MKISASIQAANQLTLLSDINEHSNKFDQLHCNAESSMLRKCWPFSDVTKPKNSIDCPSNFTGNRWGVFCLRVYRK